MHRADVSRGRAGPAAEGFSPRGSLDLGRPGDASTVFVAEIVDFSGQFTWMERLARPSQKPSITVRALARSPSDAPRVTNSGAKCSVRG